MAMKDITDLQVLQAQQRYIDNVDNGVFGGPWSYEILSEQTGEPLKVCYRCLERAAQRGLLDCGVSLRTAWITDKGLELMREAGNETN